MKSYSPASCAVNKSAELDSCVVVAVNVCSTAYAAVVCLRKVVATTLVAILTGYKPARAEVESHKHRKGNDNSNNENNAR